MSIKELLALEELNAQAAKDVRNSRLDTLPKDFTTDIPIEGRLWLYNAGLSPRVWTRHGIGYSQSAKRVVLPVFDNGNLVWQQQRGVFQGQKPKYLQPSAAKGSTLFTCGWDTHSTQRVIIVEDILSAIRVGKHTASASILGTKLSSGQASKLSKFSECTTWLDGDRAGRVGSKSIRTSMGMLTATSNITTDEDPKSYSDREMREILCLPDLTAAS